MTVQERQTVALRAGIARVSRWGLTPSTWPERRARVARVGRLGRAVPGVRRTPVELGGVPGQLCTPGSARNDRTVLYLHGGGWTVGSAAEYRAPASRLARRLGAPVWVIDYRLAPEDPFPAALEDCVAAYRGLVDAGARGIVVAGDSAGGGLTVALALAARDAGLPAPAALGLICPAVDLTEETIDALVDSPREPILTQGALREMFGCYAGQHPRTDPLLSPRYADLAGLPPVVIDSAADDLLAAQDLAFVDSLRAAGGMIDHVHHQDRWHVFHLLAGIWPPATRAFDAFADRLDRAAAAG